MNDFVLGGVLLMTCFIVYLGMTIWHDPRKQLSDEQKQRIKTKGIVHFTDRESAENIILDGLIKGNSSKMSRKEESHGPMIWFYSYGGSQHLEDKHNILIKKEKARIKPDSYDVCIHITGISDEDINKFYYGRSDEAYVYYGVLKPQKMEVLKKW